MRQDPQMPFGLHTHEFSEIVIITGGQGVHVTGEDSYELTTGDTFVIGGSRPHDYANMKDLRLINILFLREEIPWTLGDLQSMPGYHALFTLEPAFRKRHQFNSRLRLRPLDLLHAMELVEKLEQELQQRSVGYVATSIATMMQLVVFLSRCYDRGRQSDQKILMEIADAISHIQRHYSEPITLEELIEISGMSRRNFLRTFDTVMGQSPIQYLIQLRIRKACERLRMEQSNVTEIAMTTGFSDSNYFSRKFREVMGVSPTQYKRLYATQRE